jgi:MraZ protein
VDERNANEATEGRFWGTHEHALDAKGRIILPAKFREPFRDGGFLTRGADGGLALWTRSGFERRTAGMLETARRGQSQRNIGRSLAAGTFEVALDGQGRIPIPTLLREFARLQGDVIVNGAIDHIELWNPDRWNEVDAEGTQALLSGHDALDGLGF